MTNSIPKLASVTVIAPNIIEVVWADGGADRIELGEWIAGGGAILARLADPAIFGLARVDAHGCAIAWGADADLAIDAHHLRRIAKGA